MRLIGRASRTVNATAGGPTRRRRGGLVGLVVTSLLAQAVIASAIIPAVSAADTSCGARPLDVELVIDRSGSMDEDETATGTPPQTRIFYAKQAATGLVSDLDANGGVGGSGLHMVGITRYGNGGSNVVSALSAGNNATNVNAAINGLSADGNTPLRQGMATAAADMLAGDRATEAGLDVHQVIIFLSDGKPNPDPANRPSAAQINAFKDAADEVFSVAIGEGGSGPTSVDLDLMEDLAKPLDASHSFHVVDGSDLPDIFDQIFSVIACTPDIEVAKSASTPVLPASGGDVTYTYDVSNTGNVALSNIQVADDKCATVAYVSGDADTDDLLDLTEVWQFACTVNLTATTTNIVTASGTFGDQTVDATDEETVTVAEPEITPTPTPTPNVTPDPTPIVTPEPTPNVTPEPTPIVTPSPTPSVTPEPTPDGTGMMVIFKLDDMGTEDIFDDFFLDGAWFAIYLDDGDGTFEDGEDTLVAEAAEALGGFLETDFFPAGSYWIVESTVPDGYIGMDPILIELNVNPNLVCFWDLGVMECEEVMESDGLAYTGVVAMNTPIGGPAPSADPSASVDPTATPTGTVGGVVGTPRLTLPPTDVVDGETTTTTSPIGLLAVMALLGGIAAIAVIKTPAPARRRSRSDR
jgi:uncharacterized repeat protein (TIGR01451 family)